MMSAAIHRPAGPAASGLASNSPDAGRTDAARRICTLNDTFRQTFSGGRIVVTAGVQALDEADRAKLLRHVKVYDGFDRGNDPHGEHDFGRINVGGAGYYWKIDYYDADLIHRSLNPADAAITRRVMTIMREDEY